MITPIYSITDPIKTNQIIKQFLNNPNANLIGNSNNTSFYAQNDKVFTINFNQKIDVFNYQEFQDALKNNLIPNFIPNSNKQILLMTLVCTKGSKYHNIKKRQHFHVSKLTTNQDNSINITININQKPKTFYVRHKNRLNNTKHFNAHTGDPTKSVQFLLLQPTNVTPNQLTTGTIP